MPVPYSLKVPFKNGYNQIKTALPLFLLPPSGIITRFWRFVRTSIDAGSRSFSIQFNYCSVLLVEGVWGEGRRAIFLSFSLIFLTIKYNIIEVYFAIMVSKNGCGADKYVVQGQFPCFRVKYYVLPGNMK